MWFKELRLEKIKSWGQFIEKNLLSYIALFRLASFLSFFHCFVIHLYISVWHSDGTQFLVHTSLSSCVINGRTACLEDRKRHKGDISQSRLYPDIIWTNLRGS